MHARIGRDFPRPLLTIKETADLSGFSARTVERLIASGRLRSTKIGRSRRIVLSDFKELIESGMAAWQRDE